MNKICVFKIVIIFLLTFILSCHMTAQERRTDMNFDWCFARGEIPGAYDKNFNDSDWRRVDIPHDWSIEDLGEGSGPFDEKAEGQFDVGYTVGGTGWYRKTFKLNKSEEGQVFHLQFDGVYMNTDVWVNNYHVGSRAYGYSTFWFDITPYLSFNEENVIAVQVKNLGNNSRWYSGSGIYRPVTILVMDKVHFCHWGPAVSTPRISETEADIEAASKIFNERQESIPVLVITRIKDKEGNVIGIREDDLTIEAESTASMKGVILIQNPDLWNLETPSLYTLSQDIKVDGQTVDHRETPFGIRSIAYDAKKGFMLNGKPLLLQGMCMHHDHYMLGSAAYARAEERRVELTKSAGYNAIRCAHNPPSQAFLYACDRLGVLVIDEAFDQWTKHKWDHDQDYGRHFHEWWKKDLGSMILRDRNHPSIIMWSIGNEIPEQGTKYGQLLAKELAAYVKELDSSRPVTMGVNKSGPDPELDAFLKELDIVGYNYRLDTYESDQKRVPDRISYASESFSRDAFEYWQKVEKLPYICGDFVWTGWDYLGEASIGWTGYSKNWDSLGPYPWHAAYCGEIDLLGYKRPAAYYRDVLWKTGKNKISVFVSSPEPSIQPPRDSSWNLYWTYPDIHPSWTWPGQEGNDLEVVVYSACEEVELFLNNKSLGRKTTSRKTDYSECWKVPYEPGELKAVGYIGGEEADQWILKTAGKPAEIRLTADRLSIKANGNDLSYITAELFDKDGNRVYDWHEDLLIHFEIEGEGKLAGIGNGNPVSTESFQKPQRTTFQGRCVAVIKSTLRKGVIAVKVYTSGLKGDSVQINTL